MVPEHQPPAKVTARGPALGAAEAVAEAAHRLDQLAGLAQLGAEPLDVHVHRAGLDVGLRLPDGLEQLGPGLHPAPPLDQRQQQLVLGGGEVELLAADARAVRRAVDGDRARRSGSSPPSPRARRAGGAAPRTRSESSWGENGLVR